jgi:hypothetical protein
MGARSYLMSVEESRAATDAICDVLAIMACTAGHLLLEIRPLIPTSRLFCE